MLIKFNLKNCYANTFVKDDTRIDVECRQTICYLKGYSYLKLYCKKQSNQKPTANIVSTTRRTTLCWVRGNIKELLFMKLTLYLSPLFWKQILTKQNMEKWMVRSAGVGQALFLFRTGTCDVDAIFCFVKILFQKRGTNTT